MTVVSITEVGLRDGLQAETAPFSTEQKVELANKLLAAGVRRLEAASFVSPKAVPRMADAEAGSRGPFPPASSAWLRNRIPKRDTSNL